MKKSRSMGGRRFKQNAMQSLPSPYCNPQKMTEQPGSSKGGAEGEAPPEQAEDGTNTEQGDKAAGESDPTVQIRRQFERRGEWKRNRGGNYR